MVIVGWELRSIPHFTLFFLCRMKTSWGLCSFSKMSSRQQRTARQRRRREHRVDERRREREKTVKEHYGLISTRQGSFHGAGQLNCISEDKCWDFSFDLSLFRLLCLRLPCLLPSLQLLGHCANAGSRPSGQAFLWNLSNHPHYQVGLEFLKSSFAVLWNRCKPCASRASTMAVIIMTIKFKNTTKCEQYREAWAPEANGDTNIVVP